MERRFSVEAEIEILKHEISVLKALCKDLRATMKAQDDLREDELKKKNELARKTKTAESQALELCDKRTAAEGYGLQKNHNWVMKSQGLEWWHECEFCGEEKLRSRFGVS